MPPIISLEVCIEVVGIMFALYLFGEIVVPRLTQWFEDYELKNINKPIVIKEFKAEGPNGIYTGKIEIRTQKGTKTIENRITHDPETISIKQYYYHVYQGSKVIAQSRNWMEERELLESLPKIEENLQSTLEFMAHSAPVESIEGQLMKRGYKIGN